MQNMPLFVDALIRRIVYRVASGNVSALLEHIMAYICEIHSLDVFLEQEVILQVLLLVLHFLLFLLNLLKSLSPGFTEHSPGHHLFLPLVFYVLAQNVVFVEI